MSVRRSASGRAHYNYFRDYDPAVGRYVESDPIGLRAGVDTYSYVKANPIMRFDTDGLWGRVQSEDWENPDYSPCSYYDEVAKKNGCRYHAAAGDICRGKHLGVNIMADMCHLQNSRQLNCIRRCLIRKDAQARQDPSCRKGGTCPTGTCTKLSCINRYHEECFVECGSTASCYGGNYWQGFPNDGE